MESKNRSILLTSSKQDKWTKICSYFLASIILATVVMTRNWINENNVIDTKESIKESELLNSTNQNEKRQSESEVIYLADTCPRDECISESAYFKLENDTEYIFHSFTQSPERIDNVPEFSEFENVVKINLETKPIRVFSFSDDWNNEDIFYLTILVRKNDDNYERQVQLIKIDRDGNVLSTLWESSEWTDLATLGGSEKGKKMLFPKIKTRLSKIHLLIALEAPFAWNEPDRLFIINTETNAINYLGQVSISHVWEQNNFSYKRFFSFKEPCIYDGGPGPCNGEQNTYRPSGGYVQSVLP